MTFLSEVHNVNSSQQGSAQPSGSCKPTLEASQGWSSLVVYLPPHPNTPRPTARNDDISQVACIGFCLPDVFTAMRLPQQFILWPRGVQHSARKLTTPPRGGKHSHKHGKLANTQSLCLTRCFFIYGKVEMQDVCHETCPCSSCCGLHVRQKWRGAAQEARGKQEHNHAMEIF
jgi:hypothetical protein